MKLIVIKIYKGIFLRKKKGLLFIVVSAHTNRAMKEFVAELACVDSIKKPFLPDRFFEGLAKYLPSKNAFRFK